MTFDEPAIAELAAARDQHNAEREGLGTEFLDEFDAVLVRIHAMPRRFPLVGDTRFRRALFKRFPYCVVYWPSDEVISVLAVAHQHAEPLYWLHRT